MTLYVARVIIPAIDLETLAAFYRDVFGFTHTGGSVAEGSIDFAASNLTITLRSGGEPNDGRTGTRLAFGTPYVSELRESLIGRGAKIEPVQVNGRAQSAEGVDAEGNPFVLTNTGLQQTVAQTPTPAASPSAIPPRPPGSTMLWTDTPVATPTPSFSTVDPVLLKEVEKALSSNPDVFIQTLTGYPGLAVVFRDLLTRLSHSRSEPIAQADLESILKALGAVGMMGVVGKRHRRIAVFATGTLALAPSKKPLPIPMDLVSQEIYPLG